MRARCLLAMTVVCALLVGFGVTASAQSAGSVTLVTAGGSERSYDLAQLIERAGFRDRTYRMGDGSTQIVSGITLGALLRVAGISTVDLDFAEISAPNGGTVLMDQGEALDEEGEGAPVIYEGSGGAAFLRPKTSEGFAGSGGSITVRLSRGQPFEVTATAAPTKVKVGEKVTFEAELSGPMVPDNPTYSWTFGPGARAKGKTVTHTFTKPGRHNVFVGVTAGANDRGADAWVVVEVGKVPKEKKSKEESAASAPQGSGGTGGSGGYGSGGYGTGGYGSGFGGASGAVGAAAPTPGLASPAPATTPPPQTPKRPRPTPPPPAPEGELVEGVLLENTAATPAPKAASKGAKAAKDDDEDGGGIPAGVLWGGGALLLVGLGVVSEVRRGRLRFAGLA